MAPLGRCGSALWIGGLIGGDSRLPFPFDPQRTYSAAALAMVGTGLRYWKNRQMLVPRRVVDVIAPPVALTPRVVRLLVILAGVAFITSYQGSILSTLLTYPAQQWGESASSQARVLALLRFDIVFALAIVRAADRYGRRRLLIAGSIIGPILTALCALTNSLAAFGTIQFFARAVTTAVAILITVYVAEEFPTGSRAWATGALVGTAAFGSGVLLAAAAIADRSPNAWRLPLLLPLVFVPYLMWTFRSLEESSRFEARVPAATRTDRRRDRLAVRSAFRFHRHRLLWVAGLALVVAFEQTPARQLQNEFLRSERHFSSLQVSTFGLLSNAPGLIGLLLGSMWSDRHGRKRFIVVGLAGFAIGDAGMFLSHGVMLWFWSVFGALFGGLSLPALAVYTAEIFPTVIRATANGVVTAMSRIGGAVGLLAVGWVSTKATGPALAATSVGLWIGIVILLARLPETAGLDLEERVSDAESEGPRQPAFEETRSEEIPSGP